MRTRCGNYRGISINNSLYRIFDKILYRRLETWYKPSPEQAGCQKNRGCIEQILTVRLLSEYAKKTHKKLFLLFIDFEKAYDKVPRRSLLEELKRKGGGQKFLSVLALIYSNIKMVFKFAVIESSIGVRQGAATSCMSFIIYLDIMVKMINRVEDDDFLKSNHALLLMDDTVLLATSRKKVIQKFKIVQEFCSTYGMSINIKKTKFMVIKGETSDTTTIVSNGLLVEYCPVFIYLGAFITDDANCRHSIELHIEDKMKHVLKFASFLNRNPDLPFSMKKRVADACVLSSLLYGSETWLCNSYGKLKSLYMNIIKLLLKVRKTTCNDLCLIESGMPDIETIITERRSSYLRKLHNTIVDDSLLKFALQLISTCSTPMNNIIQRSMNNINWKDAANSKAILNKRANTNSSKRATYLLMNPSLKPPSVYSNDDIPEFKRVQYTRIRLSSHNLRIETGRWCRTPREERICECKADIQTEEHILLNCLLTSEIRNTHKIRAETLQELFAGNDITVVNFIHEIMMKMTN